MTGSVETTANGTPVILSASEYVTRHKQAFRTAFDYLNAHFPPEENEDWWMHAADQAALAIRNSDGNKLVENLVFAVFDYVEDECKKRRIR